MTRAKFTPVSRRERPAKPALTREVIVSTAMTVMRAEGLDRVTMRRLAQELDTGPASLYVYVRNTAELHAFLLDDLLAGLDLAAGKGRKNWRDRVVKILWSYVTVLVEFPGLAQSTMVTRPSGPGYLALIERLLALMSAEVPADRRGWAVDLLLHVATSTAAEQSVRNGAVDADDEDNRLVEAIATISPASYPHIAELGMDLLSGTGSDRLTWAFEVQINGILQTARPPAG